MPPITPPKAKNMMRRARRGVVDPEPSDSQIDALWKYFGSSCAYCGQKLNRSKGEGQLDHLESVASAGSNHISNRVLACGRCNAEDKRDAQWDDFLRSICERPTTYRSRRLRITQWTSQHIAHRVDPSENARQALKEEVQRVSDCFDEAVERLRSLNSG